MKHHFKPGDKLIHKSLGIVEYTEMCYVMDNIAGSYNGIHIVYQGEEREVSLELISPYVAEFSTK